MPRNSQGLYTLPAGNPVVPNTLIEANWANPTMDDIAAALTGSLPRDGSAPMTGPLTLASGMPTAARHATSKAYVDQFLAYAVRPAHRRSDRLCWCDCSPRATSSVTGRQSAARPTPTCSPPSGRPMARVTASTTFNVPDMRDEFIRGKSDSRPLGNKQAATFASHIHAVSDPGHGHGASGSQNAHSHSITTGSHNHSVNDPGHSHGLPTGSANGGGIFAWAQTQGATFNTNGANTGVSINGVGNLGGNTDSQTPGVSVSVSGNTTGLSIGAAGGDETRPQNIAQIYIIKAVQDASGPVPITGITTSDAQMISVDNTLPISPELVIHSNVAFGTVKLDASGQIPLGLLPSSSQHLLGYWNASGGQTPSQASPSTNFASGDTFIISVTGTLTVYDPTTLTASPTMVAVGSLLQYIENSLTNPTGWYYVVASSDGRRLAGRLHPRWHHRSDQRAVGTGRARWRRGGERRCNRRPEQRPRHPRRGDSQEDLGHRLRAAACRYGRATGCRPCCRCDPLLLHQHRMGRLERHELGVHRWGPDARSGTGQGHLLQLQNIAENLTIAAGTNGLSAGPIHGRQRVRSDSRQRFNLECGMTTKIKGTEGVEFPDATQQGTAADAGPAFYAWQNAAQSYVNGANKVNLQAKLFDTANAFNTTLSRFQPQVAGYYQLTGLVSNNLAANNQSSIVFIQKNGVTVVNGPVALGDPFNATQAGVAGLVYMNGTTDYVDMNIYCAPATGAATQSQTFFSGFLARRAAP